MDNFGTCRLCGEERKLLKSHIVPELCYRSAYDEKHRAVEVRSSSQGVRKATAQKGFRERLLCDDCEQLLCRQYESPFSDYWYQVKQLSGPIKENVVELTGADYRMMKLFHLSIIWRAHVATEFSSIDLGPYAEWIREKLLSGDPGPEDFIPIFGFLLVGDDHNVEDGWIAPPMVAKLDHSRVYALCYAGCEWLFVMTRRASRRQRIYVRGLQENGQMTLGKMHYMEAESMKYFIDALRKAPEC